MDTRRAVELEPVLQIMRSVLVGDSDTKKVTEDLARSVGAKISERWMANLLRTGGDMAFKQEGSVYSCVYLELPKQKIQTFGITVFAEPFRNDGIVLWFVVVNGEGIVAEASLSFRVTSSVPLTAALFAILNPVQKKR